MGNHSPVGSHSVFKVVVFPKHVYDTVSPMSKLSAVTCSKSTYGLGPGGEQRMVHTGGGPDQSFSVQVIVGVPVKVLGDWQMVL